MTADLGGTGRPAGRTYTSMAACGTTIAQSAQASGEPRGSALRYDAQLVAGLDSDVATRTTRNPMPDKIPATGA
jgi:hypothetical protein